MNPQHGPRICHATAVVSTLLFALLCSTTVRSADVRAEHPRIFVTAERLADLRERVRHDRVVREVYAGMLRFAHGNFIHDNLWVAPDQLNAVLLCYLIEGREQRLKQRALAFVERFEQLEGDAWTRPRMLKALALAYDWLHGDLDRHWQARIVQRMQRLVARMRREYRHSDYNNHVYLQYGPILYAGLALAGDGVADRFAEDCLKLPERLLKDHFIVAVNQTGANGTGGWPEGMAYWSFFAYELAHQLEAWHTATGEDLFQRCPGLRGSAYWLVHGTRPFDRSMAPIADIDVPRPWGNQEAMLYPLLARRYKDGLAAWVLQQVRPSNPAFAWPWVLWYDPTVRPTDPATLPPAALFPGIGWATMRGNWSDTAAWAVFVCGDLYCGHQHADQNHFVIYRQGELLIDAGGYGAQATEFHNTVLIGTGQRNFRNDPRRYVAATEPGSPYDAGEILAFEQNRFFTYVLGDASNAYDVPGVRFRRRFLFLRPDVFVVDDLIRTATNAQWLLHFPRRPQLHGPSLTMDTERSHVEVLRVLPEGGSGTIEPERGGRRKTKSFRYSYTVPGGSGLRRIIHVIHAGLGPAGKHLQVAARQTGGLVQLEIRSRRRRWRLALGTETAAPGWVEIVTDGKTTLPRRLLPAGVLPHTPSGVAMIERWDEAYRRPEPPPWDTGKPSSELQRVLREHRIPPGKALVLGCGSGTNAIYLAQQGFDVTAVDLAPTALRLAEQKAKKAGVSVRWVLADVLDLPELGTFDFLFDRGCYHGVRRQGAERYVRSVLQATRPGSRILILAGNANEPPPHYGPPRVSEAEIREDFSGPFRFVALREFRFDARLPGERRPLAWSILLERTPSGPEPGTR